MTIFVVLEEDSLSCQIGAEKTSRIIAFFGLGVYAAVGRGGGVEETILLLSVRRLEKLAKLFNGKAGVSHNTAKGKRIDRVVAWNGQDAPTITHNDVFALTHNSKPGLFTGAYRVKVIDDGNLGQR